MDTLRWGILSTARIGVNAVIPALQRTARNAVVALGSRRLEDAQAIAQSLGIAQAYGSYDAVLDDPEVDAVYIPLPNHLHVPYVRRALEAGKHVLCEKPLALTADEATTLRDQAAAYPHLRVMEAFMYRFHPQWEEIRTLVSGGEIGAIRSVHAHFSFFNDDPHNIRNRPGMGGGGLLDVGCYCVSVMRLVFGDEASWVSGNTEIDPDFEVDTLASGMLGFPAGIGTFTCGTKLARRQEVLISGTRGEIHVPRPFSPAPDAPATFTVLREGESREVSTAPVNAYEAQAEAFAHSVLDGTDVPISLDDTVANMRVLDAVVRSAETGRRQGIS